MCPVSGAGAGQLATSLPPIVHCLLLCNTDCCWREEWRVMLQCTIFESLIVTVTSNFAIQAALHLEKYGFCLVFLFLHLFLILPPKICLLLPCRQIQSMQNQCNQSKRPKCCQFYNNNNNNNSILNNTQDHSIKHFISLKEHLVEIVDIFCRKLMQFASCCEFLLLPQPSPFFVGIT